MGLAINVNCLVRIGWTVFLDIITLSNTIRLEGWGEGKACDSMLTVVLAICEGDWSLRIGECWDKPRDGARKGIVNGAIWVFWMGIGTGLDWDECKKGVEKDDAWASVDVDILDKDG